MKKAEPYNLDPVFERAVVTLACCNPRFYGRIGEELDPELLKTEPAKLALRAARAIYKDVGHGPDAGVIVIQRLRRMMADGKVTLEAIKEVAEMFDEAEDSGLPSPETVVGEMAPILQRRIRDEAVKVAIDSYGKSGDLSKAVLLEGRASRVGQVDTSVGTVLGPESWAEVASLKDLERMKTGVVELDSVLDGGLQRGGLGVLVGGSGDGKSMGLSHIGAVNLVEGAFVGYATLELPRAEVLARIKANMTQVPINLLKAGEVAEAKRALAKLGPKLGKLVVQDFTPYATTFDDIKEWVERSEDFAGREMDLLIVDYGDKVGVKKAKDEESGYSQGRVVYEGMRIYAHDRKKFCWTASQGTRQKDKRKRLDLNDVADSMHKIRVADLVVTLNVKEEGDLLTILLYVAKHRTGRSRVEVGPFPTAYEFGQMVAL